ncbi:MAG: hypothetical protein H7259_10050 [Cytophagales bacterium]|nr:hypothetical protein [Cytophaga sp.]
MRHFNYILITALGFLMFNSCRTKDGAPGPSGDDGLYKQGSITGTLKTLSSNLKDSLIIPFEFNYYETLEENSYQDYKASYFTTGFARRSLKEKDSYFIMTNSSPVIKGGTPTSVTVDLNLVQLQQDGSYFIFKDQTCSTSCVEPVNLGPFTPTAVTPTITYTNYSFDFTTGKLFYNYRIFYPGANNNLGRNTVVTGTVDVTLNKLVTL